MKEAFLRFKVEVMELGDFEDVVDCASVIIQVCMGGDSNVVHVDMDSRTEGLMLENDVVIDVVHHGLEGHWQVGECKVHDRRFEKSISGFKRCLLFVSFTNAYVVVPPSNVELCVDVCVTEIADEVRDQGKGVLIPNGKGVDLMVVLHRSQFTVLFVDKEE